MVQTYYLTKNELFDKYELFQIQYSFLKLSHCFVLLKKAAIKISEMFYTESVDKA